MPHTLEVALLQTSLAGIHHMLSLLDDNSLIVDTMHVPFL